MADINVLAKDGKSIRSTFYSLDEYGEYAERVYSESIDDLDRNKSWRFGKDSGDRSFKDVVKSARMGWEKPLAETLAIAESAVELCEREHEVDSFQANWDVTGAEVDVAAFLNGEPECMIDYPMARISKVGKVITLCASMSMSGSVDPEDMIRRGQVITALALALGKLGHATELWIDWTMTDSYGGGLRGNRGEFRVLVKGANDVIDPSRILFAYAHPGSLRALGFAVGHGLPEEWRRKLSIGITYGYPGKPKQDLPEGTLYLPELLTGSGAPDAHTELKRMLGDLGLLAE